MKIARIFALDLPCFECRSSRLITNKPCLLQTLFHLKRQIGWQHGCQVEYAFHHDRDPQYRLCIHPGSASKPDQRYLSTSGQTAGVNHPKQLRPTMTKKKNRRCYSICRQAWRHPPQLPFNQRLRHEQNKLLRFLVWRRHPSPKARPQKTKRTQLRRFIPIMFPKHATGLKNSG